MNEPAPPAAGAPFVEASGLAHRYPDGNAREIQVLKRVDLTVRQGEMVAIMGSSGSGKSTLLSILGLLLVPSGGRYRVAGRDVLALNRGQQAAFRRTMFGFVFQTCNLIENTTVYENLEFPLIYAGVRRRERQQRIRQTLAKVHMLHRLAHRSNLLSGGEQQRVAVARALVNGPRILLADEPTGQLDRHNGRLVLETFARLAQEGIAVVVVTHDPEVAAHCHRTLQIAEGELRAAPAAG
jgi:putative ABC transport system ATP-binding protein